MEKNNSRNSSDRTNSKELTLYANYFKVEIERDIFKYRVTFDPEIPSNNIGLFYRILNNIKKDLTTKFTSFYPLNFTIFSPTQVTDILSFSNIKHENVDYDIKVEWIGIMGPQDQGVVQFVGRLIKTMQRMIKMQRIGKKHFEFDKVFELPNWGVNVVPGFSTSLQIYENKLLLNIDQSYRIIHRDSLLQEIQNLYSARKSCDAMKILLVGKTTLTSYNNMAYRIDDIEFNKSPQDRFPTKDGGSLSFLEYYKSKYNQNLDANQPLIVHKKNDGSQIYLIPQLCKLIGLTEQMLGDAQLKKELDRIQKSYPGKRIKNSADLIKRVNDQRDANSKLAYEELKKWSVKINSEPSKIAATKLDAGNLLMGREARTAIEGARSLESTHEVYHANELRKWAILYQTEDKMHLDAFRRSMRNALESYKYPYAPPDEYEINGRRFDSWKNGFDKLKSSVDIIVLILPGGKKKSPLYSDCKRYLVTCKGISSQVILTDTIKYRSKDLNMICYKILLQICAKIGGSPWVIDNVQLNNRSTMYIGIDIYDKLKKTSNSLLSITATMDEFSSKFWSAVRIFENQADFEVVLSKCVIDAVAESMRINNGQSPEKIVVYRLAGTGLQQSVIKQCEGKFLQNTFIQLNLSPKPQIVIISVSRDLTTKFCSVEGYLRNEERIQNPRPGTVVDFNNKKEKDFYLVTSSPLQGTAIPMHYQIILCCDPNSNGRYEEKEISNELYKNLQLVTYKMCYLNYNKKGCFKIPAPIHYANKLAEWISNIAENGVLHLPKKEFEDQRRSLFFL